MTYMALHLPEVPDISNPEIIDEAPIVRELIARRGLSEFVRRFWHCVEPGQYLENWHHAAIYEHLEAVTAGELQKLAMCVPPGTGKSLSVGVFWPAWFWAIDPTISALFGSFDQSLLGIQSEKLTSILQDPLYRACYPHVELKRNKPGTKEFYLTAGGYRFNTSPEGKGTGRHVSGGVIDDPMKPQDAILAREAAFRKINTWFNGTVQTRVKEWMVLIMQRVHTLDLAGLCKEDGYTMLEIPMRQVKHTMWARDPRKEVGELLWPSNPRYTEAKIKELEKKLGNEASAQLQQDPTPATGGFVEEPWTRLEYIEPPAKGVFIQSWDFSTKGTLESHSKVAGELWCRTRHLGHVYQYISTLEERVGKLVAGASKDRVVIKLPQGVEYYVLVDAVGGHWNFSQSCAQFTMAQARPLWNKAFVKLIEEKANGPAIIERMSQQFAGIKGIIPKGSKEERLHRHTDRWDGGLIVYPPLPLGDKIREEHVKFPRFTHDDHVDTTTQALDKLAGSNQAYHEMLRKIGEGLTTL